MSHDKKVVGGKLRLVLPCGDAPGTCAVIDNAEPAAIMHGWKSVVA